MFIFPDAARCCCLCHWRSCLYYSFRWQHYLLHLLEEELLGAELDDPGPAPGVYLLGGVVEKDPEDDDNGAEAGEEGHLVAEEQDGGPNEEGALGGVGDAVRHRTDEVHEEVGGNGLAVEEESVQEQEEEHRQVRAQHLDHRMHF